MLFWLIQTEPKEGVDNMPNWAWTTVTIENPKNIPLNVFTDVLCDQNDEVKLKGLYGITYETLPHFDATNYLGALRAEDFPLQLFGVIDPSPELKNFGTRNAISDHKCLFYLTTSEEKENKELFTESLSNFKSFAEKFSYELNTQINSIEEVKSILADLDSFTGHERTMDWYNFNVGAMGTKWTFSLQSLTQQPNGDITFLTETAWSAPEAWMQAVANKFQVKVKGEAEYEFEDETVEFEFVPEEIQQTKPKGKGR